MTDWIFTDWQKPDKSERVSKLYMTGLFKLTKREKFDIWRRKHNIIYFNPIKIVKSYLCKWSWEYHYRKKWGMTQIDCGCWHSYENCGLSGHKWYKFCKEHKKKYPDWKTNSEYIYEKIYLDLGFDEGFR